VFALSKDEIGELGKSINYMTSILKEKINELSQENSRLENILNTMVSGVMVLDLFGTVRIINPTAEEIFGIISSTCVGKHNMEVIRHTGLNEQIKRAIKEEKIIDYEFSISYPEEKILQCYIAPVYRDNDRISGTTIVFHDITNIRKLEQMRADFVANASHELRTPLTAIKGYAETLLDGALDNKDISKNFINIINNEADRLILLVEELLALSRAEGNFNETNFKSVNISTIIKTVSEELRQQFDKKKISFKLELQQELPNVRANFNQVKQVIVNLLDNALKYTPQKGSIIVKAFDQKNYVRVEVKDTGLGIPEKDISRIFERFYRVDKARSRQMGGFGLGLSIVKHIIESSGGEIGVESEINIGSTFWFTLPIFF
jgi:two-component system phosphate regulon sensor histidine kinase PhoR